MKPGERIPFDGIVVRGSTEVDRSILSGETLPESVIENGRVAAGEVNLTGLIHIRVAARSEDSSLHKISELVAIAEGGRNNYTSLADKAAKAYAPMVHIAAVIAFLGWYLFTADFRTSINIACAVLIITCPCALGLAVPAVTTVSSGALFKMGFLLKSSTALERLANVDTFVFDKTGTLTNGNPLMITELSYISEEERTVLFSLAKLSNHPLSKAIVSSMGSEFDAVEFLDFREVAGFGLEANFKNKIVRIGRLQWLGLKDEGMLATGFQFGGKKYVINFKDEIKPGAQMLISSLIGGDKRVILLSGDNEASVKSFADEMGIVEYQAELLPEDKYRIIKELRESGENVLMLGDGMNDTAALAAANVSMAPSTALDASRVASDIVYLNSNIDLVLDAIEIARSSEQRINENFLMSFVYNIITVPLAIAGFVTPLIAALAMSSSSIAVTLNALRIRR